MRFFGIALRSHGNQLPLHTQLGNETMKTRMNVNHFLTLALLAGTVTFGLIANTASASTFQGIIRGNGEISTVDHWFITITGDGPQDFFVDTLSWERDSSDRHDGDGNRSEYVDINGDGEIAYLDTYTYLFRNDGELDSSDYIMRNDDSSNTFDDGSIYRYDSYMQTELTPGEYVVAIGAYHLTRDEAMAGYNRDNGYPSGRDGRSDHGDYQITFGGENVFVTGSETGRLVPEPSAALLGGFACLAAVGMRRRRRA